MLEIGKKIKSLREQKHITGKDLARRIGLSQSQMSRLEQGQRRIDTEILARIADALEVSASQFFDESGQLTESLSARREKELELSQLHSELGKLIRSERRQRHLTIEDLARKTGHTRAYVSAVEDGRRNGLEDGFLRKVLKLLAIDPLTVIEMEERIVRDLKTRVHRLDQALASTGGRLDPDDESSQSFLGTPILVGDESVYPAEFDEDGHPVAAVEGFLGVPDLNRTGTFALRVQGTDMSSGEGNRSDFEEGDLVVFTTERSARSGEFAFVRFGSDETAFRQIFHDDDHVIRLQPIRRDVAPRLIGVDQLRAAFPMLAHLSFEV